MVYSISFPTQSNSTRLLFSGPTMTHIETHMSRLYQVWVFAGKERILGNDNVMVIGISTMER